MIELSDSTRTRARRLLRVRYYNNAGFHPKIFIFNRPTKQIDVVIGSSNLTKGGQQTNTEANVHVTSPSDPFTSSVQQFYERVWKNADVFKKGTLKKYKGRKPFELEEDKKGKKRKGLPPTSLPISPVPSGPLEFEPPVELSDNVRWWKVAPGFRGNAWREVWYQNVNANGEGIIAIGWEEIGELTRFQKSLESGDFTQLRQAVKRTAKREGWRIQRRPYGLVWKNPRAVEYVTQTLAQFAGWGTNPLEVGDGVIAYSNRSVFAVGRIVGDYSYDASLPLQNHTRRVQWMRIVESPQKATPSLIDSLGVGKWRTIARLDDMSIVKAAISLPQWRASQR